MKLKCKKCRDIHTYFAGKIDMTMEMQVTIGRSGDPTARAGGIVINTDDDLVVSCPSCGAAGAIADITEQIITCSQCYKTMGVDDNMYCMYHDYNFCPTCFKEIKKKYCKTCVDNDVCKTYKKART